MSNSENVGPVVPASTAQSAAQKCGSWMDQLIGFIADLIGARTYKAHLLRHMFSDIFKRKHATKVEDCFAVGTASTTPELAQVDTSWPRPWVFFYVLLAGLVVYIGLSTLWEEHTNPNCCRA